MESQATPSSAATTQININKQYLITPTGILRIVELIFGLLCWALTAQAAYFIDALKFVMFASVTPWIISLALFFICLFAINSNQLSNWPWLIIEFVFNGSWGVIYFVAACVSAAYTYNLGQLIAATVFAFFTTIAYLLHGLLDFMEWRGTPIGNPRSDGVHVSA